MIDGRTLKALEFGKVLEFLAGLCVSEAGRDSASSIRPIAGRDRRELHEKLRELAETFDQSLTWSGYAGQSFTLSGFPDISPVLKFISAPAAILDFDALFAVREVTGLAKKAALSIKITEAPVAWPRLLALAEKHPLPEKTIAALLRCLGDDGRLKDESSPALALARSDLRRLHHSCLHKVKDFAKQYNFAHYLQDEFMTLASDRYVLPLKANFKGRLQGIIHDWSQTGETCYFEPFFLVEINNRLQELKLEERKAEREVFTYLTNLVRDEKDGIQGAYDLLLELDLLRAKGRLSDIYQGRCVTLSEDGGIFLPGARHPLLALRKSGAEPVDLVLRGDEHGLIISGGNAGGKTVCLKTLGLIAAMAMAGLPVPVAGGAFMPVFDGIEAFIGDEQSIEDHVSTFTAQIHYLTRAYNAAGPHSLVLLDEIGAGTDPSQGAALAKAIIEEFLLAGAYVAAATHFPALKAYALTRENLRAASVLFDPGTKRPLFKLAYDQVGASQALDVASEHGLPENILRRARQYLLVDGEDFSPIIAKLNELAVSREKEIKGLEAEKEKLEAKRRAMTEELRRERQRLGDELRQQSAEITRAYKEARIGHKQALKEMAALRASIDPPRENGERATPASAELSIGQEIFYIPFGRKAMIGELDIRRQKARLSMSGVSIWADFKDLEVPGVSMYSPNKAAAPNTARVALKTESGASAGLHLDLRGKRADLAINELEQFLDRSLLAGFENVEIIHGRGTGALRKKVHELLRTFPGIDNFSLANEKSGGDGVTIVYFK